MKEQTRLEYTPITERTFDLPENNNVAFWVIPNLEHFKFDDSFAGAAPDPGVRPDVLNYGWRQYGLRVGVWRIMSILDSYDITATAALNADVCKYEPEVVEAAMDRDWEIMGHGVTNSDPLGGKSTEKQVEIIEETRDRIHDFTGTPPEGWLGPALQETEETPDLLADAGFAYLCDWCSDDQPHKINVNTGDLISVPYSVEINDYDMVVHSRYTGPQIEQRIKDQFDVLYEEGEEKGNAKVMALSLHPMMMGQPHRSKYLDRALNYITDHDNVWITTGSEIANWYQKQQ